MTCFTYFPFSWLHNAAPPVNSGGKLRPTSRASPASPPTSQSAAPSPAADGSTRPPSGSGAAAAATAAAATQSGDSSTVQQPTAPQQTAAAPPAPSPPSPDTAPPPATGAAPVPSATLSPSAAAAHARFGRTSKYATTDSPRMLGVKCVVDFEKIYRYLSMVHKPDWECHLTAMGKSPPPLMTSNRGAAANILSDSHVTSGVE